MINFEKLGGAYETNPSAEGCAGRYGMQRIDYRSEPFDQFGITTPEFVKRLGLLFEYNKDRIRRVATINHVGERVVAKICPCLFRILSQGGIE